MSMAQQIRRCLQESPSTTLELAAIFKKPYPLIRQHVDILMRQGHIHATGQEVTTEKGQRTRIYAVTGRGRKLAQELE